MEIDKINKYEELYQIALGRFADKCDWDILDWFDEYEREEYIRLSNEINRQCCLCGDDLDVGIVRCVCEERNN